MLSTRGALTTNVAMVECAAGQNTSNRDLFLLSELETVWVAVGLVMRRHLLEGRAVQIPNFGTFSLAESHLFTDRVHRTRYFVRQLHFNINSRFATTYTIDTSHYAVEKPNAVSTRLPWAEVVEACGVPAHTASKALKEFFLYVGEGLFRKRLFQLTFPGVVTLVMKRERLMLTVDAELQNALFDVDAYRWPPEMKTRGRQCLEERLGLAKAGDGSDSVACSSRPTSSASRVSWRPSTGRLDDAAAGRTDQKKTFIAAAPSGRLFSEIEKETKRQREMRAIAKADAEEAARREQDVEQRIQRYRDCYRFDDMRPFAARDGDSRPATSTSMSRPGTSESIYHWVEATQTIEPNAEHREGGPQQEGDDPEIEAIEVLELSAHVSDHDETPCNAPVSTLEPRSLVGKDEALEKVLREEEPFSRPISRRSCQAQSAARDLIYGPAAPESKPRDAEPAVSAAPTKVTFPTAAEAPVRFGRKRYDYGMEPQQDGVGRLLKRDD